MAILIINETKFFIHYRYLAQGKDLDTVRERQVEQGLTLEIPSRYFYWGRLADLQDPDDHQIEITQKQNNRSKPG